MQHIAIDLGGSKSQVCIRDSKGKIVQEKPVRTAQIGSFLGRQSKSRVVVETCNEAFSVADEAKTLGHEIRVVPATLAKSLGVGSRGIKTDVRDARNISAASCRIDLPSVHIPSEEARNLRALSTSRERLIQTRTELVNCVRAFLRSQRKRIPSGALNTFPERVTHAFEHSAMAVPAHIKRLLNVIKGLNEEIADADLEVKALAKAHTVCQRLMSVPGVGPVTAIRLVATVDVNDRFANAHALESYLGLTPGEHSSSKSVRRTSITKAGATKVRWAIGQAAWSAWRTRPNDPMVLWARQVADRRGKKTAIVALQRKMVGILYAIWRDGSIYEPQRGATVKERTVS